MPGAQAVLEKQTESRSYTSSQNLEDGVSPPLAGQKRRHDEIADTPCIWEPFRVRVYGTIRFNRQAKANLQQEFHGDACTVFEPRLLLPRSSLPLAILDGTRTRTFGQEERIFTSHIPILESLESNDQPYTPPVVLIAQCNGQSLYAIERVHRGVYAQCKLGSWITMKHLQDLQSSEKNAATSMKKPCLREPKTWWRPIVASEEAGPLIVAHAQTASSSENISLNLNAPAYMSIKAVKSLQEASPVEPTAVAAIRTVSVEHIIQHEAPQLPVNRPLQDLDALLKSIKVQYMESLYRYKAPLAYFAKGPLSRARAAFSDADSSATSQRHLIEYLRVLVVPLNTLDKKYRETLPTLLTELPDANVSEDERTEVIAKYQRACRRSKKDKIRKNGLYPQEDVDVLRWWLDRRISFSACDSPESRAEATRLLVLEQRTRETKLQIILTLEIIALEMAHTVSPVENVTEAMEEEKLVQQLKRKKGQGLDVQLDLSIDRLCIWQSMTVEDTISKNAREAGPRSGEIPSGKTQDANHLREFCVDVVMPLTLCKKLGGPLPLSPTRPALKKTTSTIARPPKPGAAVKRPPPQPRRTLERVLTDDRTSRKRTPTLCRSATDSILPNLKREPSEVSLNAVPRSRSTLHKSKRYSQREVDLSATSQAAEAKMRKKANIEQELQGAIAALKKPNPRMAVKEFVEAAERRADGAKTKRSGNPNIHRLAQSVQIMATPAANRRKNVFASQTSQQQTWTVPPAEVDEIPSSSCAHVPVSAIKPMAEAVLDSNSRPKKRLVPSVEQTPTRGPSRCSDINMRVTSRPGLAERNNIQTKNPVYADTAISFSALTAKSAHQPPFSTCDVQSTPSKRTLTSANRNLFTTRVEVTPLKPLGPVSEGVTVTSKDITPLPSAHEEGLSIYESLGWDDDADELM
ncbi:MAG: hypothetical protein Q9218_000995 [Villophora microphyllina]